VRYPGGAALVYLVAAVVCGSPATVCPYPMSTAGGHPVKQYHHTFRCKPDDGHIRPKHVVYLILY